MKIVWVVLAIVYIPTLMCYTYDIYNCTNVNLIAVIKLDGYKDIVYELPAYSAKRQRSGTYCASDISIMGQHGTCSGKKADYSFNDALCHDVQLIASKTGGELYLDSLKKQKSPLKIEEFP
jgi:hypothetical protein